MRKFSNPILNMLMYCSVFCLLSVGASALGRPSIIQPVNNDSCVSKVQRFIWQQEMLPTDYRLQIATDTLFSNIFYNEATTNTFADVELPNYYTKYWWRVIIRYQNSNLDTSYVQSMKTKFSAPTNNLMPLDFSSCELSLVDFSWERPALSTKYRIEVSDTEAFATIIKDTLVTNANTLKWQAPANSFTYFWRIRTELSNGCASDWSSTYRFTTAYKAPTALLPLNNQIGSENSVKLVWKKYSDNIPYGIRVSKNADMTLPIFSQVDYADTSIVLSNLDLNTTYYWQVNAKIVNNTTCISDWSERRQFTTKYPAVAVMTPENNISCIPKDVRLTWHSISTARAYNVQISNNPNFPDTISTVPTVRDTTINLVGINDTTTVVTLPKGLTTYYWRVKAADTKNIGDWSDYRTMTTTYNPPVLVSPANNTEGGELNIEFKWNRDETNSEYIFQLATSEDFAVASRILVDTVNAGTISFTLPRYSTEYFWRVTVLNSSNCMGMWSAVNKIRTKLASPVLTTPINYATKQESELVLEWKSVVGAQVYDVQVATDSTFKEQNITFSLYQVSGTKVKVPNLNSATKYFWHVRAKNSTSTSNWSNFFTFTTNVRGAEVPVLVYPTNTSTKIAVDTTLIWQAAPRAISYKIEIAKDKNFSTGVVAVSNIVTTTHRLTGLSNYTVYFWRVAAVNDSGVSKWSEIRSFRTIATVPTVGPTLLYPVKDSSNAERFITFRWNSVETCDLYQIQVSKTNDFSAANILLDAADVYKTSKDFTCPQFEVKYFWRVLAINEAGMSPWSEIRSFTVKPDPAAVEDMNTGFKVVAMPNPAKDNFDLSVETPQDATAEIVISDASGRNVKSMNVNVVAGQINKIGVNTNDLNSGTYFVTIITPFSKLTEKITIVK